MRILILRSNPISPDPRVEKIARTLAGAGHRVTCLGWDRSASLPHQEQKDGYSLYRLPIAARYGSGVQNLPALLRWQWHLLTWLISRRKDYDVLHACDFDTVLPALLAKRLWKKPVIYDIFDFYADHLRRTPEPLKKWVKGMDFRAIGQADGVILADESRLAQIEGSHPRLCITIYNSPEDEPGLTNPVGQPESGYALRIAYVGLLQVERGLFEMIDVLRLHPEWHLDLAGFGGDEDRILDAIRGMPNISWHGRVPYRRALELSCQADVLFATYDPAIANHRYSSPNKVFEGMMLGKPVIAAEGTNMDAIIRAANCGIIVKYGDKAGLEEALARLERDRSLMAQLGKNGRRAYDEKYSWQNMQRRLVAFYEQILNTRPGSSG
jgi:glycosyltransferase involved in cell wall biosynthesis